MSIFCSTKKKMQKKRQTLCKEAEIFTQVHFVRERNSGRYKFNMLTLKNDPERDECIEWYNNHNNPETYNEIVSCYLKDSSKDESYICDKYHFEKNYFSNLRSNPKYTPSKGEAIIVCFAFHLSYEHTRALLKSAGYALTNSEKSDLIIRFFLENKEYNINDLDYVLNHFELPTIKDII